MQRPGHAVGSYVWDSVICVDKKKFHVSYIKTVMCHVLKDEEISKVKGKNDNQVKAEGFKS